MIDVFMHDLGKIRTNKFTDCWSFCWNVLLVLYAWKINAQQY